MKQKIFMAMLIITTSLAFSSICFAEIEWNVIKNLSLKATPVDVAFTKDGQYIYVLAEDGIIYIYSANGNEKGRINLEEKADQIKFGSKDDLLFAINKAGKTIKIINVQFVKKINVKGAPVKGPQNAPVQIVVFCDFQCFYCARTQQLLKDVLKKYHNKVKIIYKHYPLKRHKSAKDAAIASIIAHESGKFWEFHDKLFENSKKLDRQKILSIAGELGFNTEEFEASMKDNKYNMVLAGDLSDARKAGVTGTPKIFINGILLKNRSLNGFSTLINKQLQKSNSK